MASPQFAPNRLQAGDTPAPVAQRLRPTALPPGSSDAVAKDRGSAPTLAAQADSDFVIDYAAPGCVIARVRNMTFSAWDTPPTAPHVDAFIAMAKKLSVTYPLNSNVTLVMRNTGLPGAEARESLEVLTAQYARVIHSVALVIDGSGFWASMIRSFLTGLHVLRGNGYRCKAFATPAEAVPWLLPAHNTDTGIHLTESEMKHAYDAVYARMKAEGAPCTEIR